MVLVDDLDGNDATETVGFALDGVEYEIDLSEENAAKLRDSLAVYVGHARRTGGRRRSSSSQGETKSSRSRNGSSSSDGPSASEIREWARANGHTVPDRGRVSAEVREAYAAAH
ncbi:MAG: Histone protein Lsr2 [uncultured Nocardioidaceae bacterium]|uniref:Histone protein Lsr2 n=1 Tax=uncultured Nocardioidaceae bacterium TaxID=253824 RepID=A0A6J4LP57_9ACTN|nr:MAG: Histone protein Lsr2 [uncultured Nocardioidaceae bacterium]